jgi:hypothetical protein
LRDSSAVWRCAAMRPESAESRARVSDMATYRDAA